MAQPRASMRLVSVLVAILIPSVLFVLSRQPLLPDAEAAELATPFQFQRIPIPELNGLSYDRKCRDVHPSFHHIRSWISFVGAGVAVGDLDGDGLSNDLVHVDPRIDQVVVTPAPLPNRPARYSAFVLTMGPLTFNPTTMAPMGSRLGDFNEDGFLDILVYFWGRTPVVFLQQPTQATGPVPLAAASFLPVELIEPYQVCFTSAVAQADLDGDGHLDLVLGNYAPDNTAPLDKLGSGIESMMHSMSRAFNGGTDRLLLWEKPAPDAQGKIQYREVAKVLDENVARGWTFALGTADLDGDLLPEVYLVQDFGPDRLLHNRSERGKLNFALLHGERNLTTPRSLVLGCDSFNGMGIDFADLNGDGRLDIFVSNITCDWGLHESNHVFLSEGPVEAMRRGIAPYRNVSEKLGLSRGGWTWDVKFADFDNNGTLEILQAAGFTKGKINRWAELHETALGNDELLPDPRFLQPVGPEDDVAGNDHNPFWVRSKSGRYFDLAKRVGLGDAMLSRGFAPADMDGDGRLDYAVANNWERSFLYHNQAPEVGSFLGLHVRLPIDAPKGKGSTRRVDHPRRETEGLTRPAVGAVATVTLPDGRRLVAEVDGGSGHSGQRTPDLHFGLGEIDKTVPLHVSLRWRGHEGRLYEETFRLSPDRWHTLILGEPLPSNPEKTRE